MNNKWRQGHVEIRHKGILAPDKELMMIIIIIFIVCQLFLLDNLNLLLSVSRHMPILAILTQFGTVKETTECL